MINVVVKNYINLKLNKILNYDFNINFESKKNKFYKTENNLIMIFYKKQMKYIKYY